MTPYDPRTQQFFDDPPATRTDFRVRRNAGEWPVLEPGSDFSIYDQEGTDLWRDQVAADRRDRTEVLLLAACLLTLAAGVCAWKPWLREPIASSLAFVAVLGVAMWGRKKLDDLERRWPDHRLVDALRKLGL